MTDRAAAFRAWSLASYPKVEGTLLELQDRHGADVMLLLFCAWIGRLSPAALDRADEAVAPWRREVVEPLRKIRRRRTGEAAAARLREGVEEAEIEAELFAGALLVEAVPKPCGSADALALYLDRLGVPKASRKGLDALRERPKSLL